MTAQDELPAPGEVLAGKYVVEEILGAGGMGVVVAARHAALKQRVALKFLLPGAMKLPGAAARFLREAQAAVAIQSEHVARVLDVGTLENGAPFMVMEHLSGVDLSRHLKERGPVPLPEAVDYLLQASEALAEAHARGIIHRDLKPGNLFLTRRPEGTPLVKVLDFGLSKMTLVEEGAPEGSLTATDMIIGSPHYMSPEQIRSLKHVDARTDVWALGVILYQLLTGERPFGGPTATAICASVIADTPAPPSRLRPELPQGIDSVIFACLEKASDCRLPSVAHLATRLAPFAPKRSEPSVERIQRLLAMTGPQPDPTETTITLPLTRSPSRPDASPSPASPVASPPPIRGPLPSASAMPAAMEPPSGAVGWGATQSTALAVRPSGSRSGLIVAGASAALLATLAIVGIVISRGGSGPSDQQPASIVTGAPAEVHATPEPSLLPPSPMVAPAPPGVPASVAGGDAAPGSGTGASIPSTVPIQAPAPSLPKTTMPASSSPKATVSSAPASSSPKATVSSAPASPPVTQPPPATPAPPPSTPAKQPDPFDRSD